MILPFTLELSSPDEPLLVHLKIGLVDGTWHAVLLHVYDYTISGHTPLSCMLMFKIAFLLLANINQLPCCALD